MKGRFTYEMPSPTAIPLVGLSHRGSRLECHAAAAMRQPYRNRLFFVRCFHLSLTLMSAVTINQVKNHTLQK